MAGSEHPAPAGERHDDEVASAAELIRALAEDESVAEAMRSILNIAVGSIPGCQAASVTVLDDQARPRTFAATDEQAYELDRRQNALREGPCPDAARRQQVNRWNLADAQQRWPAFTSVAGKMGLRGYVCAGLSSAGRPLGALSLSSRDSGDFSQLDEEVIALYTAPAAAVIAIARRYAGARELAGRVDQAAASRAVIDQAIGIVMAESRCAADQALATLGRASGYRNMKLRDLATEIVMRVGSRPPTRTAGTGREIRPGV